MDRERIDSEIDELASRLDARTGIPTGEDVDKVLDLLAEVDKYLYTAFGKSTNSEPEPNIVVLGTTGVGKSTVVSFLFGSGRMIVQHESKYSRVLVAESPLPGVTIRSGSESSTLLPVVNHVKTEIGNLAVWDMPGNRDTRGPFVELVVHFIFQWMLQDEKDLKFILVSPPLHERPQRVMLQSMINGPLIREDNAVVVNTKCPPDFDPESTADLEIDESKRKIKSFALPAPTKNDSHGHDYSSQYRGRKQQILAALGCLRSRKVAFNEDLPDAVKLLIDSIIESSVYLVQEKLSAYFLKEYNWKGYNGTYNQICSIVALLKSAEPIPLSAFAKCLARIVPSDCNSIHDDKEFRDASHRLDCVQLLNGRKFLRRATDWLNSAGICAVEDAKEKFLALKNAVKGYRTSEKKDESNSLIISAFNLRLSQEQEAIKNFVVIRKQSIKSVEAIPNVILVGFATLTVDVDLRVWANIALCSQSIQVQTKHGFDLSSFGLPECAPRQNGYPGKDGLHGKPGLPGGNLVVVCQQLTDYAQTLRNTISCGQTGSDAQNGGDGENGHDSEYNAKTFESAIQSAIKGGLLNQEYAKVPTDLKDGLQLTKYQKDESPLTYRIVGTPGKTILEITKGSEPGAERIPAGSGGQGGSGGSGGQIRIIQADENIWEGAGSLGQKGQDGNPGEASRDGYRSPSFSATVQQWYSKGVWFGDEFAEPEIDVRTAKVKVEDQPQAVHAKPTTRNGVDAVVNGRLDTLFVKKTYKVVRARLEDMFPLCDFGDLRFDFWTFHVASEET